MACQHCKNEKHPNVPDSGPCLKCGLMVCTNPSGRPDGYYHAEQCNCGCGNVVCLVDIRDHCQNYHNCDKVEECFPELSFLYGHESIVASSILLSEGNEVSPHNSFAKFVELINSLLQIKPGFKTLEVFTPNKYRNRYDQFSLFSLDFFTSTRIEKLRYLANHVATKAWEFLYPNFYDGTIHFWNNDRIPYRRDFENFPFDKKRLDEGKILNLGNIIGRGFHVMENLNYRGMGYPFYPGSSVVNLNDDIEVSSWLFKERL